MSFKSFEDMVIWQKARALVKDVYRITRARTFHEDRNLIGQVRRAALSVMSNIAEGSERDGNREFIQYLSQAKASAGEVLSHLYAALDQEYISPELFGEYREKCRRLSRGIGSLMVYLGRSPLRGRKKVDPKRSRNPPSPEDGVWSEDDGVSAPGFGSLTIPVTTSHSN
jgi:four helix bundle protein